MAVLTKAFNAMLLLSLFCGAITQAKVKLSFCGDNTYQIPFNDNDKSFLKKAFLFRVTNNSNTTLRCLKTTRVNGPFSIFMGTLSDPTYLVKDGVLISRDSDLSFIDDTTALELTFQGTLSEIAGTYYCLASETASDQRVIIWMSFVELFVQETPRLSCVIHSYGESVFFADTQQALFQCVAPAVDYRQGLVNSYLTSSARNETAKLATAGSGPFSPRPDITLAVIIYDLSAGDPNISILNASYISCHRSPSETNLCRNIHPVVIVDDMTVLLMPSEAYISPETDSVAFHCKCIPPVVSKMVWSLSDEGDETYASMKVTAMSVAGSVLTLENINVSKITDDHFVVSCEVNVGDQVVMRHSNVTLREKGTVSGPTGSAAVTALLTGTEEGVQVTNVEPSKRKPPSDKTDPWDNEELYLSTVPTALYLPENRGMANRVEKYWITVFFLAFCFL